MSMTLNNTGADAYEEYRRKVIALKEAFFAEIHRQIEESGQEPVTMEEMMRIMHERWKKRDEEKKRNQQNSPDHTT